MSTFILSQDFPGPSVAAASRLYEFYYGPIIRINPSEIVINDPGFYNEGYVTANARRTTIWPRSHMMTEDHDLHRRHRKPLEPFFSRLGITRVEEKIVSEAKDLNDRLERLKGLESIICLNHVLSAFAGDVIGNICCQDPPIVMAKYEFGKSVAGSLTRPVPGAARFNEYREVSPDAAQVDDTAHKVDEKPTLFRHIVTSDMPTSEQSVERLSRETMVLFGGGGAARQPKIEERLKEDLAPLMLDFLNNLPRWTDLEVLPYLQAIVKERLRLSYGLMHRLPRCSPDVALQYKQWTIPKGTPVGMGAYSLHTHFEVYPDPFKFIPERWLGDYDPRMNESWVPFSSVWGKCLGYNLAIAEIKWALAVLFRPNGPNISIHETDGSDITPARGSLLPLPRPSSRRCRVRVG
ncbi:putative cytochrome P450 [Xylaria acuta]|nr:putative cytochrome P450 [Xylaria acuta]